MPDYFVHESSYVDDGAVDRCRARSIWHFCHVMPGAVIGERCNLGQNVVVMPGTRLGNNVKVQNNVSIYEGVELEDDVFCGPSCVFTNVVNPAEPRLPEARVPADPGAAGGHHRRQRHDRLRQHAGRLRLHRGRGGGPGGRARLRADGRACPPGGSAGCASAGSGSGWQDGAAVCAACGSRYREEGGLLQPR